MNKTKVSVRFSEYEGLKKSINYSKRLNGYG